MQEHVAFLEGARIAQGPLEETLAEAKKRIDEHINAAQILIFEVKSGLQRDFDFRGSLEDVIDRATPSTKGRGRPKLGVTSKEVTLLPRHWQWLAGQGRSPSVVLRALVEQAMKDDPSAVSRVEPEALWKVMSAVGGNLPSFEEATRALFGNDLLTFRKLITDWPEGLSSYLMEQTEPGGRVQSQAQNC